LIIPHVGFGAGYVFTRRTWKTRKIIVKAIEPHCTIALKR
jgi:hypothetical protein